MTERSEPWRFAVVGFDHMHAGDLVASVQAHPRAEVVGLWDHDPARVDAVADDLGLTQQVRFADVDDLVRTARPEVVILCCATHDHARWAEHFAALGLHVIVEKPFAVSLAEAERMVRAAEAAGVHLTVDWPLQWYPEHQTTRRLIAEGQIGVVTEVHYHDGNRGPLFHLHGKKVVDPEEALRAKQGAWWYDPEQGGGSLLDYLGYGVTLATWFRDGELPSVVTARTHRAPGDRVDEQSIVIAEYRDGLSSFGTRWGTFTDPWETQPFPRCGFVVVGTLGTIASYDYAGHVMVQTADDPVAHALPADTPREADTGAVAHLVDVLENGTPVQGPMSWRTSLAGQQIVDTAVLSVRTGAPAALVPLTAG